ncbi:MAG: hypothetical protein COC16_01325 [Lutibacter sp.]|nr:MAG: hypothetical protein COC16_01325 [Lutibacter sp.]
MKKIFNIKILLLMFISQFSNGQGLTIKAIESRLVTHQGVEFVGELKDITKVHYSYSNFNNKGILFLNNTKYEISNLNFNASTNSFESRINRKKLFSYKNALIDSVSINNHLFKKIDGYFYEELYKNENFSFLKKHDIKFHEGTMSRMNLSKSEGFTSLVYRYLLKYKSEFKPLKLNKKSILGLIENKEDQNALNLFVKKNKLSFKRENDIGRILDYVFLDLGMKEI